MYLFLDTSTPECRFWLYKDNQCIHEKTWQAHRELAKHLLQFLHDQLTDLDASWDDITGIAVFQGPGSFTGLRIGMTVLNTLADTKRVPIVAARGDDWRSEALSRLTAGESNSIALPFYGRDANITTPKK